MGTMPKFDLEPCTRPSWARDGHSQTILGHLIPTRIADGGGPLEGDLVTIPLPDGDNLVAKHVPGPGDTVLYLFHGIASDISAGYMTRAASLARKLGWDVYLVNHRGC